MKSGDVVELFFESLKKGDLKTVQNLYALNSIYKNPVYPNLSGMEAGKMWELMTRKVKNYNLDYKILGASRKSVKAFWTLNYTTSRGKRVSSQIKSDFEIVDNQIYTQADKFNYSKWIRQSKGLIAWLFGIVAQTKLREVAEKRLNLFITTGR